jgi:hypothetical protein
MLADGYAPLSNVAQDYDTFHTAWPWDRLNCRRSRRILSARFLKSFYPSPCSEFARRELTSLCSILQPQQRELLRLIGDDRQDKQNTDHDLLAGIEQPCGAVIC